MDPDDLAGAAALRWTDAVAQQRFRLISPMLTVPSILAAAAQDTRPQDHLAAILRAAYPALRIRLDPSFRAMFAAH